MTLIVIISLKLHLYLNSRVCFTVFHLYNVQKTDSTRMISINIISN